VSSAKDLERPESLSKLSAPGFAFYPNPHLILEKGRGNRRSKSDVTALFSLLAVLPLSLSLVVDSIYRLRV